ncbi:mediator complex, subunit Med21/Med9 [Polychaeton citri CBS 116435]|uniref:Mediator of RNA polymerase II transcription subunit 21 n=1 Tax=Polychaeton citri CBS 116435 TaxID=1314669 RepID=A0A9P4QBW1_9PEZI|nr:mediator complex, subunit Med21/Med9 [Polychaeton citri CBS 116435]
MADRLTQLQDCVDDLLTQMFATLKYIQLRHPFSNIPGQPSQAPTSQSQTAPSSAAPALTNGNSASAKDAQQDLVKSDEEDPQNPEEPAIFQANMRELARDLILKEQQIEYIIQSLPGIGSSEAEQLERMKVLEAELRAVGKERLVAESEREGLVELVGSVLSGIKRVPG